VDSVKVVGIDLAGTPSRASGFAVLREKTISSSLLYSDEEIIDRCTEESPDLVAIDAPLSKPRKGGFRESDLGLVRRGLRVLPPGFKGMKGLTARGMRLSRRLKKQGLKVIEVHPRSSGVLLFGTSDRKAWVGSLKAKGYRLRITKSIHEIDAALAAVTGFLHLKRKTEAVGRRGKIILPLPRALGRT
jgi:hypothetical protein